MSLLLGLEPFQKFGVGGGGGGQKAFQSSTFGSNLGLRLEAGTKLNITSRAGKQRLWGYNLRRGLRNTKLWLLQVSLLSQCLESYSRLIDEMDAQLKYQIAI